MDPKKVALGFILNSDYFSLSTTDGKKPWTTPIYFAVDNDFSFYFVSRKDTQHSVNIYKNKNVSFCIFNSEDRSFTAQGLQASGVCTEVKPAEALKALFCIYKKKHPSMKDFSKIKLDVKSVTGLVNNRVYKIVPSKVFVLDSKNPDMDTRVEVFLK